MSEIAVNVRDSLDEFDAAAWNSLEHAGAPFLRHQFLSALEHQACVGEGSGWLPRYLTIDDHAGLAAAAPMYIKLHSYGEFVFDWSWAEACERAGIDYYPKLVVAVPFTPCTAPRMLLRAGADGERMREALLAASVEYARSIEASSVHWLFPTGTEMDRLEGHGLLRRAGCQFHWHNHDYGDFDAFLATLTSKRRKQIRRERRDAAGAPVNIELRLAADLDSRHWQAYHALYSSTFDRKWGFPPLTAGFFEELARTDPQRLLLAYAERDGRMVAGAHFLVGEHTLYGRNWGCSEFHPALHFELCYYQGIEFCIRRGLRRFEAGAQGEHKLMRGFLPETTWSAHWIAHPGLRRGVADFVRREHAGVRGYVEEMDAHTPFRVVDSDRAVSDGES